MTAYLVYSDESAAQRDEQVIFVRGAQIAKNNGYEVSDDGILSKTVEGETTDSLTVCWDVPRQRADGKWVVRHPCEHSAASNEAWLAYVMRGITALSEIETPDWWPVAIPPQPHPTETDAVQS